MTKKHTKRALFASALSMLLCVSMLIGSTFAWFTDTASTSVNTIQAGTLDVELLDGSGASLEGRTLKFVDAQNNVMENFYIEPNGTYKLEPVTIKNAGNVNLKYKVQVSGIEGNNELLNVLEWKFSVTDSSDVISGNTFESSLGQGDSDIFNIEVTMKKTAGKEYMGKTLSGVKINVVATQATGDSDSINDEYDAAAEYPAEAVVPENIVSAGSQNNLNDAITKAEEPTEVKLSNGTYKINEVPMTNKDITFTGTKDTVIDMSSVVTAADSAVTFDGVTLEFDNDSYEGLQHSKKEVYKNCTIKGTMFLYAPEVEFINCTFEEYDTSTAYSVWTYGAQNVTFTNCTFNTHGKAVLVYTEGEIHADITLNKCTFTSDGTVATNKAAVEVGSSPSSMDTTYNLTFTNCTQTGFVTNNSTNALWGNKDSMDASHLNVVINGQDVY